MKVITNADDLGECTGTNNAIFDLMAEGLLTSATILANAPGTEEACRRTIHFPNCSFGVHLNLTEFRPLAPGHDLVELVDGCGNFSGKIRTVSHLERLRAGIFEELSAQIGRIRSRGVDISHLDSHHHVHTIPILLPVLRALLRRFDIPKVRISKNLYSLSDDRGPVMRLKKNTYNMVLRKFAAARTTDLFTDLAGFQDHRPTLERRNKTVEIMLHPGGPEGEGEARGLRNAIDHTACTKKCLVSYRGF